MTKVYRMVLTLLLVVMIYPAISQEKERRQGHRTSRTRVSASSSSSSSTASEQQKEKAFSLSATLRRASTENYYITTPDEPWGSASNVTAMNGAFGENWSRLNFDDVVVATIFSDATKFVFLEGSDDNATELSAFLTANRTAIEAWVHAGGRLLLNAAPNEGGNFDFGFDGTTLNYNSAQSSVTISADLATAPNELQTLQYSGSSFSHAHITGANLHQLIVGGDKIVLADKLHGDGFVVFGGMTTANYHQPQPDGQSLRANILYYTANHSVVPSAPVAALVALPTQTLIGKTVVLYDVSANYPTARQWTISPATFEYVEGTSSTSGAAKVKFTAEGTYTVTLTSSNDLGESTITKEDYITVSLPGTFYWVGGSGTWSDYENHWAKTSGGDEFHANAPTADDHVFFDANSFDADGQIVDIEWEAAECYNLSFEGVTHTPELTNGDIEVHGSIDASSPVVLNVDDIGFVGSGNITIDLSGAEMPDAGIWIEGEGIYSLAGNYNAYYFDIYGGTFKTNGYSMKVVDFYASEDSYAVQLDLGTSEIYVLDDFESYAGEGSYLNSKFKLFLGDAEGEYSTSLEAYDVLFNEVILGASNVDLWSDNSFQKFVVLPGVSLDMNGYEVTASTITAKGTEAAPISIISGTFIKTAGNVTGSYVALTNVVGTGGASFFADVHSTDNGGNTGWVFSTKEVQVINFTTVPVKTIGDAAFTLTATSTSGLPVSYSVSGPATINGNTVTITGAGPVTLTAAQAGDDTYLPADEAIQVICVNPAKPTITATNNHSDAPILVSSSEENNTWYFNGEVIFGVTGDEYPTTTLGTYTVKTNVDGCYSAVSNAFVLLVTEVEQSSDAMVRIYPNPVQRELIVDLTQFSQKSAAVSIFDATGKVQGKTSGKGVITIGVQDYKPGQYILQINVGGKKISRQFIKN